MQGLWRVNQEQGSAGILALINMAVLLVLGGTFITLSVTELDISREYRNGIAAQYLAEAGVQWAIVKLKAKHDYVTASGGSFKSQLKNAGTPTAGIFAVEITGLWNTYKIKSSGIVGDSEKTAARRLAVLAVTPLGVYAFPAYSDSSVNINDGSRVLQGLACSRGPVTAKNESVQGGVRPNQKNFNFPNSTYIDYSASPSLPNLISSGEAVSGLAGIYYVNGDFTVGGSLVTAANSLATIYANGKVIINRDAHITGKLRIISAKEIEVNGNINSAILIACGTGNSLITHSAKIYGSIISRGNLIIDGSVTYDQEVIKAFAPYLGQPFTISAYNDNNFSEEN
ncbi:hypothetical protein [Sporomusa aerivorans]|uniref:hypothetical protein n=1 Tax=Sporomusa aerivorans TaxID=204936 RepID=UPI00352ABC22